MNVKQVWMSADTAKRSHYGLRTLGGMVGIVALMLALILGGVVLSFALHLPRELFSLLLVLGVVAFGVCLAVRLGRRTLQDATLFFLTEDDRLFLVDARALTGPAHNPLDYSLGLMKTQQLLRTLSERSQLPSRAVEILKVEGLNERSSSYVIRCQVRHGDRHVARHTYFLVKGTPEEDLLVRQLERRQHWETSPELAHNPTPFRIVVSGLLSGLFIALCVLSHPAVGQLPNEIYFPCLGAAFVALCLLVCFAIGQHRGE